MDEDLTSIQQARSLLREAREAFNTFHTFSQEAVDRIVRDMVRSGIEASERLARMAVDETGFGRVESKVEKNLFATKTLHERMAGMKTCGVIRTDADGSIWEIGTPMGVVAALIPSTNPTSTAMYKAIIAAKARCAIVMSPHPRAAECTHEALRVVAEAAYRAGAPAGLFGCMTEISLSGTEALMEDEGTDLILATGGSAMVHAAYSKGKPAYGVGSGNVPVWVDRSADVAKAAADILHGASFDWGTLCSTERSIIVDVPVRDELRRELKKRGGFFVSDEQKKALRQVVQNSGRLNVDQVGQSPQRIAEMAGFDVPKGTKALIAGVDEIGRSEPLSMETLSPILSMYEADGWEAGCEMCKRVLAFGGIGHTLAIHCTNERVIEAFALEKPAMRIVVNTVAALGSVGYTNELFPAMTLGPGTIGGSITSDNISPLHLLNVKRLAFETRPIHAPARGAGLIPKPPDRKPGTPDETNLPHARIGESWMEEIEARLRDRAGNPSGDRRIPHRTGRTRPTNDETEGRASSDSAAGKQTSARRADGRLSDAEIDRIAAEFRDLQ